MANIAALLQQLQGGGNKQQPMTDPLGQLLQSRGAAPAPFSSGIQSQQMPNLMQQQAHAQDQSSDFYGQLNAISDNVAEQRQAAEDAIARNSAKAQQDALMRKIRSMIPQQVSTGGGGGYSGGGGGGGGLLPILPGGSAPRSGGGGGLLPILPDIGSGKNGSPWVAAPPRSRLCDVRPDLC